MKKKHLFNKSYQFFIILNTYQGHIRYITTSSIETAPLGLIFPFQKVISELFPKSFLFLRRQWKHNYKYGEFVNQLIGQDEEPECFDTMKQDFDFRLSMVAYPSMEDDNYLYNCNIAHEVGHYIDDLTRIHGSEKDFIKDLEINENQTEGDFNIETYRRIVTLQWHEEFISDTYATYMLGPAYLFSFLEYHFSGSNVDQVFINHPSYNQRSYPSPRMRLYYILKTLSYRDRNYVSVFEKSQSEWSKLLLKKINEQHERINEQHFKYFGHEIGKFAWETNKKLTTKVLHYAYKTLIPVIKSRILPNLDDEFNKKVETEVKEKLKKEIPINESLCMKKLAPQEIGLKNGSQSKPLTLFSMLNYGWMMFFEIIENNKHNISETKNLVNNLTLLIKRSAEASYFHQQWNEYRSRIE